MKTGTEGYISYYFIYMNFPELVKLQNGKINDCLGWFKEKWGVTAKGCGISPGGDESVLKFIVMVVAQLCEFTKTIESYVLNP